MELATQSVVKNRDAVRYITLAAAIAILLALLQYGSARSLWLDEAFMGLNVLGRSGGQLFQPLDYHVVAPLGWLQLMKWSSILLSNIDFSLRLIPMLGYLATVLVCLPLSRVHFGNLSLANHSRAFTVLLLATNASLLYFSNEAKPYSMDVLMMAVACWLGYLALGHSRLHWYWLGGFGIMALWLSNAAVMILTGLGIWLAWHWLPIGRLRIRLMAIGAIWLAGFSLLWYFFIRHHPSMGPMQQHWALNGSFMPHAVSVSEQVDFWINTFREIGFGVMRFKWMSPLVALAVLVGGVRLWKRYPSWLLCFLAVPFLLQLVLSWFRLYPMEVRLMLYLAVPLTLLAAEGMSAGVNLLRNAPGLWRGLTVAILALALFVSLLAGIGFPLKREELRPVLETVQWKIKPGEAIYVFHKAVPVVQLYGKVISGLDEYPIRYGEFFPKDRAAYLRDMTAAGKRVWLVMTTDHMHHAAQLVADCDAAGCRRLATITEIGAQAILMEFP